MDWPGGVGNLGCLALLVRAVECGFLSPAAWKHLPPAATGARGSGKNNSSKSKLSSAERARDARRLFTNQGQVTKSESKEKRGCWCTPLTLLFFCTLLELIVSGFASRQRSSRLGARRTRRLRPNGPSKRRPGFSRRRPDRAQPRRRRQQPARAVAAWVPRRVRSRLQPLGDGDAR